MRIVDGKRSALELARKFAHAFIPIALAYLVAHYFSLVVYQEQAQFTFLLSDPLGDGSDLFGTAGTGINYWLIGATAIWYVQFGAIVVGHVIALALGHDRALALWKDSRTAAYSQVWMLVDDGLLQRPRPLPALAGERLTCRSPVAHAGHWLPYVVPAAVVLVAVIVATLRERRREGEGNDADAEDGADDPTAP